MSSGSVDIATIEGFVFLNCVGPTYRELYEFCGQRKLQIKR